MFKTLMTNTRELTVPGDGRMRRAGLGLRRMPQKSWNFLHRILRHCSPFCGLLGNIFSLDCPHNHWRWEVLQMEGDATPCNAF